MEDKSAAQRAVGKSRISDPIAAQRDCEESPHEAMGSCNNPPSIKEWVLKNRHDASLRVAAGSRARLLPKPNFMAALGNVRSGALWVAS